jgi:hypothetical protein
MTAEKKGDKIKDNPDVQSITKRMKSLKKKEKERKRKKE